MYLNQIQMYFLLLLLWLYSEVLSVGFDAIPPAQLTHLIPMISKKGTQVHCAGQLFLFC